MVKNGHFWAIFLRPKNVSKWLKIKGNALKRSFPSILSFLRHFLVEKMGVKISPKIRLTPYKKLLKMTIFQQFLNNQKTSPNGFKWKECSKTFSSLNFGLFKSIFWSKKWVYLLWTQKKTCFEWFRNFQPKQKGGPQASLALAKGGPQGNFEKFKKCFKPFKTFTI